MTTTRTHPDATFGRRLREVRRQSGITQQQLASRMAAAGHKRNRSAIAKTELGTRPVSLGEAVTFAAVLGVPLLDLLTDPAGISPELRARLNAQIAVRALQHQAAEYRRKLREAKLLYDDTARRLAAAQDLAAGLESQ